MIRSVNTIVSLLLLSIVLSLLFSCKVSAITQNEASGTKPQTIRSKEEEALHLIKADQLPGQGWQKSAVFPDWKGYTDDTLAMNSMLSFYMYHGQGRLWLKVSDEVESFVMYVNEKRVDTDSVDAGVWEADISSAAKDGVNTLQISGILPLGLEDAVEVYVPYPEVIDARGSLEGIRKEALELISDIIGSDIDHGFTSTQLAVVRNGRLVYENAWGLANSYEPDAARVKDGTPVTTDTLYDLASVTKMFSVNYAVQKLVTEEKLDVDTRIVDILGDGFAEDTLDFAYETDDEADQPDHKTQMQWKKALTVRDILCHQAGFPAGPAYYRLDFDMAIQDTGEEGSNLCYARTREDTLKAICKTPLLYEPGSRTLYSDVDYMLLCFVVEKVTGEQLDNYLRENFFEPLDLSHITYLPLENGFAPEDCAATELNGNTRDHQVFFDGVRTQTLQGEVHDQLAWECMEGVSGHAGLFSNAGDLAKLASVMITGGYGEHRFFSRNVMDSFTAPKAFDFSQWGLGWWREGDDQRVWYFGTQAASDTIGHQGWTGTLAMIDPSRNLVVVYLTNKINSPVREGGLDQFEGGSFTASTLGFVPQILSIGMDSEEDVSTQLLDLAADLAAQSLKLIPEETDMGDSFVQNALSKINVLEERAQAQGHAAYLELAEELRQKIEEKVGEQNSMKENNSVAD